MQLLRLCTRKWLHGPQTTLITRNLSYSKPLGFPRNINAVKPQNPTFTSSSVTIEHEPAQTFANSVKPGIRNQILFFVFGSTGILLYSAWATNIETSVMLEKIKLQSSIWSVQSITNTDLRRFQQSELVQQLRNTYKYLNTQAAEIPLFIKPYLNTLYIAAFQPYADASEGRRLCWKICLFNAGIWLLWQFQRNQAMMSRAFLHQPLSGLSYTLLTSTFSHKSLMHLLFNCFALEGFGSAASTYLRQAQDKDASGQLEATSNYHFLTFFASAGIFSGLVSHIASAKLRYPKLIAQLSSPANTARPVTDWASAVSKSTSTSTSAASAAAKYASSSAVAIPGSLGASGAVYSCATLVALAYPGSQVSLIFPPVTPIDIQTGIMGMVALDIFGILRGWRVLDHWAHLGGAVFGVAYYHYGTPVWSWTRGMLKGEA